jgi:YD repeat-containing protein
VNLSVFALLARRMLFTALLCALLYSPRSGAAEVCWQVSSLSGRIQFALGPSPFGSPNDPSSCFPTARSVFQAATALATQLDNGQYGSPGSLNYFKYWFIHENSPREEPFTCAEPANPSAATTYYCGNKVTGGGWNNWGEVPVTVDDSAGQWLSVRFSLFPAEPPVVRDESCSVGNPVQPGSGTKRHSEADYVGAGAHPLSITREYRSDSVIAGPVTKVELRWMHSFQARLIFYPYGNGSPVVAVRPDATIRRFTSSSTGVPRSWQGDSGTRDSLLEVRDAAGALTGWQYAVAADDSIETYDPAGRLLNIKARSGWLTTLSYNPAGQLTTVANQFGRQLRFTYDSNGRLAELLPPGAVSGSGAGTAASPIRYSYDEALSLGAGVSPGGQLTSVTWQDGTIRRYHYEDTRFPHAMTGITDESGVRFATYAYDAQRRVIGEQHAGGANKLDFSYGTNQTTITDYSGPGGSATQRTYTFSNQGGVLRPVGVSAPCPLCGNTQQSSSYDAAGAPTKTIAHDGSVTFYAYDTKARATFPSSWQSATTRPALGNATKVVSTQWHATFYLPTQIAEPNKVTANTYNSKGMLTSQGWTATTDATGAAKFAAVKTGSTYATTWGYNANSLITSRLEKIDGATVAQMTYTVNAAGDATKATNPRTGLSTTSATYDAHGRLTREVDPYGTITRSYSPRGLLFEERDEVATTSITHNAIGLVTQMNTGTGQVYAWTLNADHSIDALSINGVQVAAAGTRAPGIPGVRGPGAAGAAAGILWELGRRLAESSDATTTDPDAKKDCDPCKDPTLTPDWSPHGGKHINGRKGKTWPQIRAGTGGDGKPPAKYHPAFVPNAVVQRTVEMDVWGRGKVIENSSNLTVKVVRFGLVVGASDGKDVLCVRVECSGRTVHGRPIADSECEKPEVPYP